MSAQRFDADVVVDARDCILGRVASQVAERALDGERIAVVNAERAVITGSEEDVMSVYRDRERVGSDKGPRYPKRPDRIFKRAVRGMLPYTESRGREALERVRVYVGDPYADREAERSEASDGASGARSGATDGSEDREGERRPEGAVSGDEGAASREAEVLEDTSLDRLSNIRFVSLGEVSENLGANVTW